LKRENIRTVDPKDETFDRMPFSGGLWIEEQGIVNLSDEENNSSFQSENIIDLFVEEEKVDNKDDSSSDSEQE